MVKFDLIFVQNSYRDLRALLNKKITDDTNAKYAELSKTKPVPPRTVVDRRGISLKPMIHSQYSELIAIKLVLPHVLKVDNNHTSPKTEIITALRFFGKPEYIPNLTGTTVLVIRI